MSEHNRVDHGSERLDAETMARAGQAVNQGEAVDTEVKIVCNACPVLCRISPGRSGACDRYANVDGALVRVDPLVLLAQTAAIESPLAVVPFAVDDDEREHVLIGPEAVFVTGIGASSTYPDYKPAPFIVSSQVDGVDLVTVVTEGIFSYASYRIKVDTDRFLGEERSLIRCHGEIVGHVTTTEYGSQMLSVGGVRHLTGGSKKEGRVTCDMMLALGNQQAVELDIEGGSIIQIQSGRAPIVNGVEEERMRVGCGSATIGIFAQQWQGLLDEVIVIDDHITGVLSEHQAGRHLAMRRTGIRIRGRKSTPGRYFQVAEPGTGWGGTDLIEPLDIIDSIDPALAWPGLRLLMVSTTGEHSAYFVLDQQLALHSAEMPDAVVKVVERIGENCEPSQSTVLFVAGAGGSLRAGVTDNPVLLTRAIKKALVNVTCGGAPTYIWPGGGITFMVDVARMPAHSFGSVPTPAIVAPLEFTMRIDDYRALGGHMQQVRALAQVLSSGCYHVDGAPSGFRVMPAGSFNPWPLSGHTMLG